MSSATAEKSPYRRDNYFAGDSADSPDSGHREVSGVDRAEHIARGLLLDFVSPVCSRTLDETGEAVELSEPYFYLPKTQDREAVVLEYGQNPHTKRVNEETGYINGGETTSTAIPQVGEDTYMRAVSNFLLGQLASKSGSEIVLSEREKSTMQARRQRAKRLFNDQEYDSHGALAEFIRQVREGEI